MISKDFFSALDDFEKEKGIPKESFISALENALTFACKRNFGEANNVEVKLNPEKATIRVFAYKTVVETVEDPDRQISLEDARKVKEIYNIGDHFIDEELSPKLFSRIAAQTAKAPTKSPRSMLRPTSAGTTSGHGPPLSARRSIHHNCPTHAAAPVSHPSQKARRGETCRARSRSGTKANQTLPLWRKGSQTETRNEAESAAAAICARVLFMARSSRQG